MSLKRNVTIKDVAKVAGVGVSTVSRVLNRSPKISPEARWKVNNSIEKLGYAPNRMAQGLRSQRYQNIAFLVSHISNYAVARIAMGLQDVLDSYDYSLSICNTQGVNVVEKVRLFLQGRNLDGIVLSVSGEDDFALHELLLSSDIPIVALDRYIDGIPARVEADYYSSVKDATNYLLSLGHRNIILTCGTKQIHQTRESIKAFSNAFEELGLPPPEHLIECGNYSHEFPLKLLEKYSQKIKDGEITAILNMNCNSFIGLLHALRDVNLEYPRDLSIITVDDSALAQLLRPAVTIIERPLLEIGCQLGEILIKLIENPDSEFIKPASIPTKLVIRDSCRQL